MLPCSWHRGTTSRDLNLNGLIGVSALSTAPAQSDHGGTFIWFTGAYPFMARYPVRRSCLAHTTFITNNDEPMIFRGRAEKQAKACVRADNMEY